LENLTEKGASGLAQGVSPEFKPQDHKKVVLKKKQINPIAVIWQKYFANVNHQHSYLEFQNNFVKEKCIFNWEKRCRSSGVLVNI
jgi:hypothetical protein